VGGAAAGRPIWEAVTNPTIQEVVRRALETGAQKRVELELPRTQSVIELSATRLPGEPCPGVILVLHDVTELRRLENIRQQFVSNVSLMNFSQSCHEPPGRSLRSDPATPPLKGRLLVARFEKRREINPGRAAVEKTAEAVRWQCRLSGVSDPQG